MEIIEPSWKILDVDYSFNKMGAGLLQKQYHIKEIINKHIEYCGRTCYKSIDKITEDSASKFVERMIKSQHYSTLEHAPVYLKIPLQAKDVDFYFNSPYCRCIYDWNTLSWYVSTSYRVIIENGLEDDLQYLCEPTEFHTKRITVKFISSIHFYKDLTRHRKASFSIESTRFIDYMKERFGTSISFINPNWLEENDRIEFEEDCKLVESLYFKWRDKGWKPEEAAYWLIQGTKSEIVMSAFVDDWKWIFKLRTSIIKLTGMPHKVITELIDPLYKEFINRNYIKDLTKSEE